MPVKIAPSMLSSDFARMGETVRELEQAGADYLHFDVMDGKFVPNLTLGPVILHAARPHTPLFFDVHLMIERPERFIEDFAKAGASGVTVHVEAVTHLFRLVDAVHRTPMKVGVALCPGTPLSHIEEILPVVDLVLIMTVDPGFGGQAFIPTMIDKVQRLSRLCRERGVSPEIEVDGGVDFKNAPSLIAAGATVLVSGSGLFHADCPMAEAIRRLRSGN